jgi:tetratricopeptide (TPR) repeat protein
MTELDAEELFHLALKASEDGDRDKTIAYLKRSIDLDPQANSIYLLAAEYAEIGMMQRAIDGMQRALELNPELWTAYFQLGLIFLTQDLIQEARNAWTPLTQQSREEHLFHLGTGLIQLVNDQPEDALESLTVGMNLNQSNAALNRDVMTIIDNISAGLATSSALDPADNEQSADELAATPSSNSTNPVQPAEPDEEAVVQKQHLFLSNYGDGSDAN